MYRVNIPIIWNETKKLKQYRQRNDKNMVEYAVHITKLNDRLDLIAGLYYGNCFKIQPIYDANPHIKSDAELKEGIKLLVPLPEKGTVKDDTKGLPPWKRT